MAQTRIVTVVLADQHPVVRAGIRAVLTKKQFNVVGEAGNGLEAIAQVRKLNPSVLVMDIAMPLMNGLLVAINVKENSEKFSTRVLLLSSVFDDRTIQDAMQIGVHGFLCKNQPIDLLPEAVSTVVNHETWYDQTVREHIARYAHLPNYAKLSKSLTPRETVILQMIAENKRSKDIASLLNISERTVEHHRDHLTEKLGVRDTAGLTRYAILAGITQLSAA